MNKTIETFIYGNIDPKPILGNEIEVTEHFGSIAPRRYIIFACDCPSISEHNRWPLGSACGAHIHTRNVCYRNRWLMSGILYCNSNVPSILEPRNNDGRTECFWCKILTEKRGGGIYNICPKCGR